MNFEYTINRLGIGDEETLRNAVMLIHGVESAGTELRAILEEDSQMIYVAEDRGAGVLGLMIANKIFRLDGKKTEVLIYEIDVIENARRNGIATSLIQAMVKDHHGLGDVFVLTNGANEAACKFYKSLGLKELDKDVVMFEAGIDEIPV